jgi:NAD-dependent SIR2 family protein deacetylase
MLAPNTNNPRKDHIMTMPTKVTVDGVPRYVAYTADQGHLVHFECEACGQHETSDKPYIYLDDEGFMSPLCYSCVRGAGADPRFIWWREALLAR